MALPAHLVGSQLQWLCITNAEFNSGHSGTLGPDPPPGASRCGLHRQAGCGRGSQLCRHGAGMVLAWRWHGAPARQAGGAREGVQHARALAHHTLQLQLCWQVNGTESAPAFTPPPFG